MRLKYMSISAVCLYLFAANQMALASPKGRCTLPAGLDEEISQKYPGTKLVSLADLDEYKRKLFHKDHGTRCPGLARVDFYGDGKPTWALVLISGENPQRKAQLVIARQVDKKWEIRLLDTTDGTPVVWSEGAGKYDDLYGKKTITATRPVVVFCGLESFEVVFAWTGNDVAKVQISD